MPDEYYTEGKHVGQLIAEHRNFLGVTLPDLISVIPRLDRVRIAGYEDEITPTIDQLEDHHQALMKAYVETPGTRDVTAARREQYWTTEWDNSLFLSVLDDFPRTTWWWVMVSDKRGRGAFCNYCAQMIHSYDVGSGVRKRARMIIMRHRAQHIEEIETGRTADTEGTDS